MEGELRSAKVAAPIRRERVSPDPVPTKKSEAQEVVSIQLNNDHLQSSLYELREGVQHLSVLLFGDNPGIPEPEPFEASGILPRIAEDTRRLSDFLSLINAEVTILRRRLDV